MTRFFQFGALISSVLLLASWVLGLKGFNWAVDPSTHMLLGLLSAIVAISLHCLIFGIFTGSGKDTRELVEDLSMNKEYALAVKSFRKITFPPALYAILLLVLTAIMGGAFGQNGGATFGWIHFLLSTVAVLYNWKTFILESRSVAQNATFLNKVNKEATDLLIQHPEKGKGVPEVVGMIEAATDTLEWESHVFAFGRFLIFLSYNVWLVFIYLRFIVGYYWMPVWPYLIASLALYGSGLWLKKRYTRHISV